MNIRKSTVNDLSRIAEIFLFNNRIHGTEIYKLYVDPFFQNNLIGKALITFAIENYKVNYLWALEKNTKAISFYQKYGFHITKYRKFEEDTTEYLIKLER